MLSTGIGGLFLLAMIVGTFAVLTMIGRIEIQRSGDGQVLVTDDGPDLHTEMPRISGRDLNGREIGNADYEDRDWVLLLASRGCLSCQSLLRSIRATRRGLRHPVEIVLVLEASKKDAEALADQHRFNVPVIVDDEDRIRQGLGVTRSPYGFLVDGQGIVRMKGVVNTQDQLEGLIHRRGKPDGGLMWEEQGPGDLVSAGSGGHHHGSFDP